MLPEGMSEKDAENIVFYAVKGKNFPIDKLSEEEYAELLKAYKRQVLDKQKDRD